MDAWHCLSCCTLVWVQLMYSDDTDLDDFLRQLFPPLPKPTREAPDYRDHVPWKPSHTGEEPPF